MERKKSAYQSLQAGYDYASSFREPKKSAYQSLQDGYKHANQFADNNHMERGTVCWTMLLLK